jgi:hypothetical protein
LRRTAVLALTTLCAIGALALPANASFEKCNIYETLNWDGKGTSVKVCVNVSGSQRAAYLIATQYNNTSISINVSSLYLRQCDAYGHNCIVIAQNAGSAGGATAVAFYGDWKPVSFGHTYIACASLTANGDPYTNICSNFWTN